MSASEDLRRLPDGTRIVVTWSDGTGPHEYALRFDASGAPCAELDYGSGGVERFRLDDLSTKRVEVLA